MAAGQTVQVDRVAALLGRRMRRLREGRGLSQEKLAQKTNVSRETVRRVEAGLETTTAMIDRLLWAMGADAEELLSTPSKRGGKARRPSTYTQPPLVAVAGVRPR